MCAQPWLDLAEAPLRKPTLSPTAKLIEACLRLRASKAQECAHDS
jgi:hypothetical protein